MKIRSLAILPLAFGALHAPGATAQAMTPRVVFRADQNGTGSSQLYSVDVEPAPDPVLLSDPGDGGVERYHLSSDGKWVVYRAGAANRLHAVRSDGRSHRILLSPTLALDAELSLFQIGPRGDFVTFQAQGKLYSVPLGGGAPQTLLSGSLQLSSSVGWASVTVAGDTVLFLGREAGGVYELYSVPLDGSLPAAVISGPLPECIEVVNFLESWDGEWITFSTYNCVSCGGHACSGMLDIWSLPADRSGPPIHLAGFATFDSGFFWRISLDSTRLGFRDGGSIWTRPLDGSEPLAYIGDGNSFVFTADGMNIVYATSDKNLHVGLADGSGVPLMLNDPLVAGGEVRNFLATPSGRVLYRADQITDEQFELFSVPIDRSEPPVRLNSPLPPDGDILNLQLVPDGERAVALGSVGGLFELRVVPIDGSQPSMLVAGPYSLMGNGARAVGDLLVYIAFDDVHQLYVASLDGSFPPLLLSDPPAPGGAVHFFVTARVSTGVRDRAPGPPLPGGGLHAR